MIDNLQSLIDQYKPVQGIWNEDDELVDSLKIEIEKLDDADKIIFVLYCETGSLREVGKMLGVSHTTVYKEIKRIKKQLLDGIRYFND